MEGVWQREGIGARLLRCRLECYYEEKKRQKRLKIHGECRCADRYWWFEGKLIDENKVYTTSIPHYPME
ncbi:hypothetical protein IV203_021717 [Nitzschia inconspicua]|uniref:Uncharacterized protein n=1 Tax=Nitzschia inconspicua TaxID=303405 RepID=A0A9K3PG67_9STRA|nr:hypothetical protein IV203_021717 [Nitzschia inconspicua]